MAVKLDDLKTSLSLKYKMEIMVREKFSKIWAFRETVPWCCYYGFVVILRAF